MRGEWLLAMCDFYIITIQRERIEHTVDVSGVFNTAIIRPKRSRIGASKDKNQAQKDPKPDLERTAHTASVRRKKSSSGRRLGR